jgi:hypothetical protein
MPCVHCLQHVKSLGAANFAHDDPVWAHPQPALSIRKFGKQAMDFDRLIALLIHDSE